MRLTELIETGRRDLPGYPTTRRGDCFGWFELRGLRMKASDGSDWVLDGPPWEHVSVSTPKRCPTWDEMCWVKRQFWGPDETVIQFHPPQSEYVNNHPHCLHLWKPVGIEIPLPPSLCVGLLATAKAGGTR